MFLRLVPISAVAGARGDFDELVPIHPALHQEHIPKKTIARRLGSHEIHRRRVELVRSAGAHAQSYLGRLREGPWVFADQIARLSRLVERFGAAGVDKACARAQHFDALDGVVRVERILERGLHELALEPLGVAVGRGERDFGRNLREYDAALQSCKEA